jgi:dTDP-4-amino-4,6-dideoxygalactose transaminase
VKNIQFFDYPALYTRFEKEFDAIFKDVCSRGAFILQKDLVEFEAALAEFVGTRHALGVADGTNALIIGLKALDIGPGDEVIISPHTYVATAASIHLVGATPVFADIGEDNLLSASAAEMKITSRTRAIMPTQVNGRCADMDAIGEIVKRHGLITLEDSAQGLGAKFKGKCAGTFGPFGTLSFYPAKLIGCFGDGGAVMTDDDEMAEKLSLWRDHGRDKSGRVVAWGTNVRLDNLQAAFLHLRLRHFDEDIARRREIARKYHEGLSELPELRLPPPPVDDGDHFDVYQNYELAAEDRDRLKAYLAERGVRTIVQWAGTPVHHFSELGFGKDRFDDLPRTDWFFERCLMLPMHMALSDEDVNYVIEQVRGFYKEAR